MAAPLPPDRLYAALKHADRETFDRICAASGRSADLPSGDASRTKIAITLMAMAEEDDQIRRLIEAHLPHPLPEDALEAFRYKQYTYADHIPLLGAHEVGRLPIRADALYVTLGFSEPRRHFDRELGGSSSEQTIEQVLTTVEAGLGSGDRRRGVVIVGDPGSGKTTLLKQLYLRVFLDGSASLGLTAGLTPVLVRADRLAVALAAGHKSLPDVLGAALEAPQVAALLARDPLLLLVDALDEAGGPAGMEAVSEWLHTQASGAAQHRWALTSRFGAWRSLARCLHGAFHEVHVYLLPLHVTQQYIRGWYRTIARVDRLDAKKLADEGEELCETVASRDFRASWRLAEMAGNPLMLSLMCLVHRCSGALPPSRAALYEACLTTLLDDLTVEKKRGEGATWTRERVGRDEAVRALAPFAWWLHERQAGLEPVSVPTEEAAARLGARRDGAAWLTFFTDDCGLLQSPDLVRTRFSHLSFQEHLVAKHAAAQGDDGAAALAARLGDSVWEEPIELALGLGPALHRGFWRAALRRPDVGAHEAQLRSLFRVASSPDTTALDEVVGRAVKAIEAPLPWWRRWLGATDPSPSADAVWLACGLLGTERIGDRAEALARHPDERVRAAVTGAPVGGAGAPQPGERRVLDCFGVPLEVVWHPPGRFWMGASRGSGRNQDDEAWDDEAPVHEVTLTRGFWLGMHPVTVAQYRAFLARCGGDAPRSLRDTNLNGPDQPVTEVDWADAGRFAASWSPDGLVASLTTEAEWEYAARGGNEQRRYPWGSERPDPTRAWWVAARGGPDKWWNDFTEDERSAARLYPAAVGGRPRGRSRWGAEDLAGNVWEWCQDGWNERHPVDNVVDRCDHGDTGSPRVVRGGSWNDPSRHLRASTRFRFGPEYLYFNLGFRVVLRPGSFDR
jgi:formylglycine-generating enzyme required for sulfatase activity